MLEMIPGMNKSKLKDIDIDEKDMAHTKAIIPSICGKGFIKSSALHRHKLTHKNTHVT